MKNSQDPSQRLVEFLSLEIIERQLTTLQELDIQLRLADRTEKTADRIEENNENQPHR